MKVAVCFFFSWCHPVLASCRYRVTKQQEAVSWQPHSFSVSLLRIMQKESGRKIAETVVCNGFAVLLEYSLVFLLFLSLLIISCYINQSFTSPTFFKPLENPTDSITVHFPCDLLWGQCFSIVSTIFKQRDITLIQLRAMCVS